MFEVLKSTWALMIGVMLLMIGNGMQGTLLGIRGVREGFSVDAMAVVMAAYFVGFLFGSRLAPGMIRRVGHVRVFAALGSLISAVLILYPLLADPVAWVVLRALIGFCFSGVYVTAESWLNNMTTNETRGQALSAYVLLQMAGIVTAQTLIGLGDPSGFALFIVPSVLVSLSFTPTLLSVIPVPIHETARPLSLTALFAVSPLGCVGMLALGLVFSALFGMSAVFATEAGLGSAEVASFVASIYVGGLLAQFPVGWLSDRMDRRRLILAISALGGIAAGIAWLLPLDYGGLLAAGLAVGAAANPLYALLIAYTNDYLDGDDMASASAGLVFINGLGAILGPIVVGRVMALDGPRGFFLFLAVILISLAGYALWRSTRRPALPAEETGAWVPVLPTATPVAVEVAAEVAQELAEENEEPDPSASAPDGNRP